jgi:hypothetical protein
MLAVANEGYFLGKLGSGSAVAGIGVIGLLLLDWKGDIIAIPSSPWWSSYQIIKRKKAMAAV